MKNKTKKTTGSKGLNETVASGFSNHRTISKEKKQIYIFPKETSVSTVFTNFISLSSLNTSTFELHIQMHSIFRVDPQASGMYQNNMMEETNSGN